ncbi:MAG: hypothetical protein H6712_01585 [Myxococcales bacterium]|nr:hypothetical protein [Myxococcales bacterium]MCB9712517.1 hypothetical protein [Myxococcales bacterium]
MLINTLAMVVPACQRLPVPPQGDDGEVTDDDGTTSSSPGSTGSGADGATSVALETSDSSPGSSDDSVLDDGCGFLCVPDAGHIDLECDVAAQDCPDGQKCVWAASTDSGLRRDGARCIEVTGDGEPFAPCTLPTGIGPEITDDCGAESYCLEVYGTADHGFCAPFTNLEYDCREYPGTDVAVENGSSFPAACLYYECQPLIEGSCPDGMQCTFYPAWLYASLHCWSVPPEYDLPLGASCDFGQCGEGKLCAPAEWLPECTGDSCCTEWCDLSAPACATPGTVCEPYLVWNHQGDPGFDDLGACVQPGALR